jgi:branched-subunit amino acid transport protein
VTSGAVWAVIALAALTTLVTKGIGPAATGSRELPAPAVRVVVLLAAPLLAALVVTNALADGDRLHVGADTAGALVAALLVWRRAHVLLVVVAAAAVTAGLRATGLG